MIKMPVLALLAGIVLFFCSEKKNERVLNPGNLRSQFFKIDPGKDTTIIGLRGGIFKINKETFSGNQPVDIEIKEVYSPAEILIAGLTTESDGRLLESGGMIYFNARRKTKQLELLKPVDISIPTHYINEEMKLFKGDERPDGSINWIEPKELDTSVMEPAIDTGKIIFMANCASCHNLFTDATGPKLAWVETKNERKVLKEFIRNPGAVMAEYPYFRCQKEQFKSMMTSFPLLTDEAINSVLDYIRSEEPARPDLKNEITAGEIWPDSINSGSCLGLDAPCGYDTIYVDTTQYESFSDNIISPPQEATKADTMDHLYKKPEPLEEIQRQGFTDRVVTRGRYNFKIQTTGWFNVDAFYEGLKGTETVDLFVKSDYAIPIDVHVFFPAKKLLTVGVYHNDDELYHFEKYKGQIPLFLNDEAIAFGVTSVGEKIFYGITPFKVTKNQTVSLKIKESTKGDLMRAFKEMELEGIDLDIITKKRIIIPKECNDTTLVL